MPKCHDLTPSSRLRVNSKRQRRVSLISEYVEAQICKEASPTRCHCCIAVARARYFSHQTDGVALQITAEPLLDPRILSPVSGASNPPRSACGLPHFQFILTTALKQRISKMATCMNKAFLGARPVAQPARGTSQVTRAAVEFYGPNRYARTFQPARHSAEGVPIQRVL